MTVGGSVHHSPQTPPGDAILTSVQTKKMTNDQRQLMIGQLRCGKTGDQIMSILDSIVADYMPELKYNDTVVPAKYAPASGPIEF